MTARRSPLRWAPVGGLVHAAAVLGGHRWLGLSDAVFATEFNAAVALWTVGGAVLVGATVGVAYARDRVVAPLLVVGTAFALALLRTLPYREALVGGFSSAASVPYNFYELGWPVLLGLSAVAWAVERRIAAARGLRETAPE